MPKNQGCFCCKPTVQSPSCVQEMTWQQLYGHSVISAASPNSFQEANHSLAANTIPIDVVTEASWQQDASLNINFSHPTSQPQCNSLQENSIPPQIIHEFEMFQIQDSNKTVSNKPLVTPEIEQQTSFNFRMLPNRELGCKIAQTIVTEMKPSILSSDHSGHSSHSGSTPNNGCDNVTVASATSADSMDLDSALDELGMLSSVTNSRRQYLLETRGLASFMKRDQRLHSKSESSPNLSISGHPNGYHIVQMNSNFVSSLSGGSMLNQTTSLYEKSSISESSRWKYRNPIMHEETTRRQRSVPRMSRMRKDRYMYRRSRCPYKIPIRLSTTLPEPSSIDEYFCTYSNHLGTSPSLSDSGIDTSSCRLTNCQLSESNSDTASPIKAHLEVNLVRSLSAEDLTPICRRLERELNREFKAGRETEQGLDSMTSQMTHLHMS